MKLWRNTRSCPRSRHLNMMPPRATSRSPAAPASRPLRISFRRALVVSAVVPVRAPLMHIIAKIVEPICIRRIQTHRLRPQLPPHRIIWNCLRHSISPRIQQSFHSTTRRAFPFRFARQAIIFSRRCAQPLAITHRLVPRHRNNWHPWITKVRILPVHRLNSTSRRNKAPILRIRHRVGAQLKRIHPYAMHRLFIIAPRLASHPKPSLRHAHHPRLDDSTPRPLHNFSAHSRRHGHTFFPSPPTSEIPLETHSHYSPAARLQAASSISCYSPRPAPHSLPLEHPSVSP
jgi:hypothetical protein